MPANTAKERDDANRSPMVFYEKTGAAANDQLMKTGANGFTI